MGEGNSGVLIPASCLDFLRRLLRAYLRMVTAAEIDRSIFSFSSKSASHSCAGTPRDMLKHENSGELDIFRCHQNVFFQYLFFIMLYDKN